MRHTRYAAALLVIGLIAAGCAPQRKEVATERASARRSDVITREEFSKQHYNSAYELVAAVRPQWLLPRGRESFNANTVLQVHLNGARMGTVATLRQVAVAELEYLQFYDATAASARFGMGYGKGMIDLSTKPRE